MINLKDYLTQDVLARQASQSATASLHELPHERWELIVDQKQHESPPCVQYAPIDLNLVTPDQKQCLTVKAQLISQELTAEGWVYRIKWID